MQVEMHYVDSKKKSRPSQHRKCFHDLRPDASSSRIEAYDLVEECAVVMWNIARELMSDQNRFRVHKPLQSLSFKDSKTLFAQRILLVVSCVPVFHFLATCLKQRSLREEKWTHSFV